MSLSELRGGGTVLPITRWGTPVMHAPTRQVTAFDDRLHELVKDMFATMEAAQGVGLAANQVGVDLAVFVFDCPDDDHQRHVGVICNPVVTLPEGKDRRLDKADEGCLSLPGAYGGAGSTRPRRLPRCRCVRRPRRGGRHRAARSLPPARDGSPERDGLR